MAPGAPTQRRSREPAPVVAVLVLGVKGRRVHPGPQRARTLGLCGFFPAKPALLWGREGGPSSGSWTSQPAPASSAAELAAAVLAGEGNAPVVAVLLASSKGRRVHCCPKGADPPFGGWGTGAHRPIKGRTRWTKRRAVGGNSATEEPSVNTPEYEGRPCASAHDRGWSVRPFESRSRTTPATGG